MGLAQSQKSVLWILVMVLVLAGVCVALVLILNDEPDMAGVIDARPRGGQQQVDHNVDPADDVPLEQFLPNAVLKLDPDDALARNLALPVNHGPNPIAPPFVAQWLGASLADATKCLASAVYYEAAGEPMAGQRAVAQVVLNRLRNPRYPKTICEVVYQGAERPTGCQFSFACDGSTRRVPSAAGWAVATAVATSVLNGVTSTEAGQATHYHTLAVFPAWAPQLAKIGIIGHHVFYRPPGHSTFGYNMITRAPPEEVPVVVADPISSIPEIAAPAGVPVAEASVPAHISEASSLAQSEGGRDGAATSRRSTPATEPNPPVSVTPVSQTRQSMFPIRRTRTPNLPLASDH